MLKTKRKKITKKKHVMVLTILVLLTIFYLISNRRYEQQSSNERIVVFVLDGVDWRIINRLVEEDRLKNIEYLINNGVSGKLQSVKPIYTPPALASLFSGKLPSKHGIKSHFDVSDGNTKNQLYRNMKVKTAWEILKGKNTTIDLVGFLEMDYAPRIDGTAVAGLYIIKKVAEHNNYFSNVNNEMAFLKYIPNLILTSKNHGTILANYSFLDKSRQIMEKNNISVNFDSEIRYVHIPFTINSLKYTEERKKGNMEFSKLIRGIETIFDSNMSAKFVFEYDMTSKEIALDLYKRHKSDMLFVYFTGADVFSHNYYYDGWHFEDKSNKQEQLYKYYEVVDGYIGEFLGSQEVNVTFFVISDHGAQDTTIQKYLYQIPHEPPHTLYGIFIAKGEGIKQGYKINNAKIVDIMPTLFYMYDMPIAKDFDGKVLLDIFEDNHSRNKAIKYIPTYE